jgi:hypothetical protein
MPALADRPPSAATSRLVPGVRSPTSPWCCLGFVEHRVAEIALRARADGTSDREDVLVEWFRPALSFSRRAHAGHGVRAGVRCPAMEVVIA